MGLLKGIATAVLEKTKDEVKEYLQKLMEEEKKRKEEDDAEEKDEPTALEPTEEEQEEEPVEEIEEVQEEEEIEEDPAEDILPIINEDIERLNYKFKPEKIMISYELADLAQQLPLEDFSLYIKMVIFSQDQKKNYGYLGNSLKKKLGLADMDIEDFNAIAARLEAYGLLHVETVSDNQKTYILYLPFDEELMKRTNASKAKKQVKERNKKVHGNNRKTGKREDKKQEKREERKPQDDEIPGKASMDMHDDDLYKSYRTFVNLEIDKAKMRVGRSNFDKIYMEAVKYIDKKYGFKVLSDSDKFKEYLTNYYISAFDIKTFEEWKKNKV